MRYTLLLVLVSYLIQSCVSGPQLTDQELRTIDSIHRVDSLKNIISETKLLTYNKETFIVKQFGQMFMSDYQDVWIIKDGILPASHCYVEIYRKDIKNAVYVMIRTNHGESNKIDLFVTKTEYNVTEDGTQVYYNCQGFKGSEFLLIEYMIPTETGIPDRSFSLLFDYNVERKLYMNGLTLLCK